MAAEAPLVPPAYGVPLLPVEVAYATPHRQLIVNLQVPAGTTVEQAIEASALRVQFPAIGARPSVGIFSRKVTLDTPLEAGDRVEIYRPLAADPKEARRQKVTKERAERENIRRKKAEAGKLR
ncbi:MAG TPA: RnfH family protein [Xanthomonadales bacterium]|nr:RnfH family protein [Xanthomonadales bacterium]